MSELRRQLIAQASGGALPPYVGAPFVDINGFHLSAPLWMQDRDILEWEQSFPFGISKSSTGGANVDIQEYDNYAEVSFASYGIINGCITPKTNTKSYTEGEYYLILPLPYSGFVHSVRDAESKYVNYYTNTIYRATATSRQTTFFRSAPRSEPKSNVIVPLKCVVQVMNITESITRSEGTEYAIKNANDYARQLGYDTANDIPRFSPDVNGKLVAYQGKLYYYVG